MLPKSLCPSTRQYLNDLYISFMSIREFRVSTDFVCVYRDDDIEVLTEDGGKAGGETSPNRPLSRTPRWDLYLSCCSYWVNWKMVDPETVPVHCNYDHSSNWNNGSISEQLFRSRSLPRLFSVPVTESLRVWSVGPVRREDVNKDFLFVCLCSKKISQPPPGGLLDSISNIFGYVAVGSSVQCVTLSRSPQVCPGLCSFGLLWLTTCLSTCLSVYSVSECVQPGLVPQLYSRWRTVCVHLFTLSALWLAFSTVTG